MSHASQLRVLFLADQFSDVGRSREIKHPGGAELTDDAAVEACPYPLTRLRFSDFQPAVLSQHDLILLGNSQRATPAALSAIADSGRHVLFEHDLRICSLNGNFPVALDPAHRLWQRCWCPHPHLRRVFDAARGVIFLTELQREHYAANPFFHYPTERTAVLGCSLFNRAFFSGLTERALAQPRSGACVLGSPSVIKGTAEAASYARARGWTPRLLKDLPPAEVLSAFRTSQRLVYLPRGLEPAGRMPVEARLNGCEVVVNAHLGVAGEAWWSRDRPAALAHLSQAPTRFWQLVTDLYEQGAYAAQAKHPATARAAQLALSGLRRLGTNQRPRLPTLGEPRRRELTIRRYTAW